jgi:signal transduction histidine kinase
MVLDEEWLIEQEGGRRIPIAVSAAPVRQEDGSIAGAVVILQDITRRKSLERQRTEYISLISHDLRGPLTVISLQAAALANSTDPLVPPRAAGIQANVRRLTTMIGDMVETSRLETGQTPIEKSEVDVATALHRLVGTGLGEGDRQRVTLDVAAGLPPVCLDPARFERVILNLIGNARKYAGKDWRATISARVVAGDLYVSVADRGPGIAATDLPHLFEKHFRGQQSGKAEGLGLGLYICRLIVEGHGGRIWAENRPEGGAVIRMRFPAASTSERTAA